MRFSRVVSLSSFVVLWSLLNPAACSSQPRVVVSTQAGRELPLHVEIADTPAKRALGLQYRRELADDRGMLFLFPEEKIQSFWMKDTPISLDIIFIGSDRRVVGIVHEAAPFSTTSLTVQAPSQFVLEIKGGIAKRTGIAVGDTVSFEGISLDGVRE